MALFCCALLQLAQKSMGCTARSPGSRGMSRHTPMLVLSLLVLIQLLNPITEAQGPRCKIGQMDPKDKKAMFGDNAILARETLSSIAGALEEGLGAPRAFYTPKEWGSDVNSGDTCGLRALGPFLKSHQDWKDVIDEVKKWQAALSGDLVAGEMIKTDFNARDPGQSIAKVIAEKASAAALPALLDFLTESAEKLCGRDPPKPDTAVVRLKRQKNFGKRRADDTFLTVADGIQGFANVILAISKVPIAPTPLRKAASLLYDALSTKSPIGGAAKRAEDLVNKIKATCEKPVFKELVDFLRGDIFHCWPAWYFRLHDIASYMLAVQDVLYYYDLVWEEALVKMAEKQNDITRPTRTAEELKLKDYECRFGSGAVKAAVVEGLNGTQAATVRPAFDGYAVSALRAEPKLGGSGRQLLGTNPIAVMEMFDKANKEGSNVQPVLTALKDVMSTMTGVETALKAVKQTLTQALQPPAKFLYAVEGFVKTLDGIFGWFDKIMPVFEGIAKVLSFIECPKALGFICDLTSILDKAIDEIVKAVSGKTLAEWFGSLLEEIGLGVLDDLVPGIDIFMGHLDKLREVGDYLEEKTLGWYRDAVNKFRQYMDFKLLDPMYRAIGPNGITYMPGVLWKLDYEYAGAPVSFQCPSNAYPIVKEAMRMMYSCQQVLSAYMRYPCPGSGLGGCSYDYNQQWKPNGCLEIPLGPNDDDKDMIRQMMGFSGKLPYEDYFRVEYFCVNEGVDFSVLAELMEGSWNLRIGEDGTWDNTRETRYSAKPTFVIQQSDKDSIETCINGNRRFLTEYVRPPNIAAMDPYTGSAMSAPHLWHPCLTQWNTYSRPDGRDQHRRELCWYTLSLAQQPQNIPAGTQFDCRGDASGKFWVAYYGQDTNLENGDDNYIQFFPFRSDCDEVRDRMGRAGECPIPRDKYKDDGVNKACNRPDDRPWRDCDSCYEHRVTIFDTVWGNCNRHCWWHDCREQTDGQARNHRHWGEPLTPQQFCERNYDLPRPSAMQTCLKTNEGCDPGYIDTYEYWPDMTPRKLGRQYRQEAMNAYRDRGYAGDADAELCARIADRCDGEKVCELAGCVPQHMQWSCVPEEYFAGDSSSTGKRSLYIFGSSLNSTVKVGSCPAGQMLQIASADFGEALSFTDVKGQLAANGCSGATSSSCTFDIKKLAPNNYQGKTLKVDYVCLCGAGKQPSPVNGTCQGCPAGTYRALNMANCEPCPPGFANNEEGQTRCTPCTPGQYSSSAGALICQLCPAGHFANLTEATVCTPCPKNTYRIDTAPTACLACGPGNYTEREGTGDVCKLCAPGTYKTQEMGDCVACPAGQFSAGGAGGCLPCASGTYAPAIGTGNCTLCPIGSYQPNIGASSCLLCPVGTYNNDQGAVSADSCNLKEKAVDYDAEATKLAAQQIRVQAAAAAVAGRRRLMAAGLPPGTPTAAISGASIAAASVAVAASVNLELCRQLLQKYGVTDLTQVGNGMCNGGPWNSAVCGYDGGDCCVSTCTPVQILVLEGEDPPPADMPKPLASCDPTALQCRDPAAIRAEATANALLGGDACTPADLATKVPEPSGITDCPAGAQYTQDSRYANGLCDDELNVQACNYDGGDCCPTTCKRTLYPGSCRANMNCRDPNARADKVPPVLLGVPTSPFERNASRIYLRASMGQADDVNAVDNFPCFNSTVQISDENITLPRTCSSGVVWYIKRTWSVVDRAGNRASASQVINVVDDQWPELGSTVLTLPLPSVRQTLLQHTVRVPVALPNKAYTWSLIPQPGTGATTVLTKTGFAVSFSVANTAAARAEILATNVTQRWDVFLAWVYTNCSGGGGGSAGSPIRWRAGVLEVSTLGKATAVITGAKDARIVHPGGRAVLYGTSSTTSSTGGIVRYTWIVTNLSRITESYTYTGGTLTFSASSVPAPAPGASVVYSVQLVVQDALGFTGSATTTVTVLASSFG